MNQKANPGGTSSNGLEEFAKGVAERVTAAGSVPWVVFGPKWAQESKGAEPPPEDLSDPVWARGEGWMEKSEAPIEETGDGEPLALYAPDSMDEVSPTE